MGRRRVCLALLVSAGTVGLASACKPRQPAPAQAITAPSAATALAWPPPPHRARIRFVAMVAAPRDLGIKPSLWSRLAGAVAGRKEDKRFIRPTGVTVQGGSIFVADPGAQALWILSAARGTWSATHTAGEQRLVSPVAVAPGPAGTVFLADSYLRRIVVYRADGHLQGTIAGGHVGTPVGLAYDLERDRLYVADARAHVVRVLAGAGSPIEVIGRRGVGPGELNFPTHLALDREGRLYVTDALNFRVQMFAPDGSFLGMFGEHGDSSGQFAMPKGVAVDSEGHVYVVDALFDAVQIFDRRGRYLLTFGKRGTGPGEFWLPGGVYIDQNDRIYVADSYNRRIEVFQYIAEKGDAQS